LSAGLRRIGKPALKVSVASEPESPSELDASGLTLLGARDYRLLAARKPSTLFRLGAIMLSPDAVDLLARSGTRKKYDWAGERAYLEAEPGRRLPRTWRMVPLMYAACLHHIIE